MFDLCQIGSLHEGREMWLKRGTNRRGALAVDGIDAFNRVEGLDEILQIESANEGFCRATREQTPEFCVNGSADQTAAIHQLSCGGTQTNYTGIYRTDKVDSPGLIRNVNLQTAVGDSAGIEIDNHRRQQAAYFASTTVANKG